MENSLIQNLRFYVVEAIKDNKSINQKVIDDIINIAISYYKLENWVKKIKVLKNNSQKNNSTALGLYNHYEKQITFYIQNFKNSLDDLIDVLELTKKEQVYFIYYELLVTILHELEHANQTKSFFSINEDIESLIIKNSFGISRPRLLKKGCNAEEIQKLCDINRLENFEMENYNISPVERLANLKAIKTTIQVFNFNDSNKILTSLRNWGISNLYDTYLSGYEEYSSPTETFIKGYNPLGDLEKIHTLSESLPFKARITYGLHLSPREYSFMEEKAEKIYDKI